MDAADESSRIWPELPATSTLPLRLVNAGQRLAGAPRGSVRRKLSRSKPMLTEGCPPAASQAIEAAVTRPLTATCESGVSHRSGSGSRRAASSSRLASNPRNDSWPATGRSVSAARVMRCSACSSSVNANPAASTAVNFRGWTVIGPAGSKRPTASIESDRKATRPPPIRRSIDSVTVFNRVSTTRPSENRSQALTGPRPLCTTCGSGCAGESQPRSTLTSGTNSTSRTEA